ncbi:hypothetical protein MANY_25810 [Mycolicibacterium anyangense]|uniref:Exported repetitive protein n=1 Tax=Mycolicibacterium anyangense TaxID=1431246 RepID=A0A6N4WB10_9MYCO|nr:hypothetical protein [Mycolicibacterium anyangense]BBZ77244.1 hypothetical protein MANY_25810 [Mycolicibacterium anyangense]
MSRFTKLFAANAIGAAGLCSAALALSPTAAADPALPPAVPGVPALNMLQQIATNPASAAALVQTAATALTGASALTGAAPQTLPVSPIAGAPATAPLPATPAPAPTAGGLAGPIIPLLNQLGVPGNLANLTPESMPFPVAIGNTPGISNPPASAPVTVPPASNPPIAPTTPGGAGLGQLLPLSALP